MRPLFYVELHLIDRNRHHSQTDNQGTSFGEPMGSLPRVGLCSQCYGQKAIAQPPGEILIPSLLFSSGPLRTKLFEIGEGECFLPSALC